ncbi:MAG TPA: hypothetical protein VHE61_15430 [Opitutaceae bacterium]|nr:hypothetical protein [Opitutaceae bacterium]
MKLVLFPWLRFPVAWLAAAVWLPSVHAVETIEGAGGVRATFDASGSSYEIRGGAADWSFRGQLPVPVTDVARENGTDRLGNYTELRLQLASPPASSAAIRVYRGRPAVLFLLKTGAPSGSGLPLTFPEFTGVPSGLHRFSYRDAVFSPPSFKAESNGTPWLLFDDRAQAAIVSPADHFMIARLSGDGRSRIASGLNPGVRDLPAGFTQATLLVFGQGINATWDAWGRALQELVHRKAPANDADAGLRYLGYWTDNGADYYYNYDPRLGYAGTLEALVTRYRREGIPIRYLQLDSWWYEKTFTSPEGRPGGTKNPALPAGEWNRYGGLLKYEADPALFPDGLGAFQRRLGLPLITHNRWVDPASPYRATYRISGYAAVDPRWWHDIMTYLGSAGVGTYEQDWLNIIYEHSPTLSTTVGAGDAFTGGMARAAAERGLSLQYCMALPRYFLQGARYDNLTTIRVSDDRFERSRWDRFLYTSRLASALGIWPWVDVFKSGETDNLILADLSGGMVGTGDRMGAEDRENLLRVARPDGVLVKPDAPLVPIDAMYLADARGDKVPMVATTFTQHEGQRTLYVFAYNRRNEPAPLEIEPASLGIAGDCWVYDVRNRTARRVTAGQPCRQTLGPDATLDLAIAPVTAGGWAFFGDAGKFVSTGRKRIAEIAQHGADTLVKVVFAAGEGPVTLFGYAGAAPRVAAESGRVGPVNYSASTGRFEFPVTAAPERRGETPGNDPVQEAVVTLSAR